MRERRAVGVRWCCRFKNKERGEERRRNKRNGIQCNKEKIRENVLGGARVLLRVIGWMTHPYTFSEFTLTTPP